MLQQLIHIIIISFIVCLWGIPFLLISGKTLAAPHPWYRSFMGFLAFLFISGCITLSILASWLYLFIPLKFYYLLGLTAALLLVLGIFCRRGITALIRTIPDIRAIPQTGPILHTRPIPQPGPVPPPVIPDKRSTFTVIDWSFLIVYITLFATLSCLKPVNIDTQIYHVQIISWATQYRAVPGMANLYLRLGLGSDWFALISFFHIPLFRNGSFSYLNVTLTGWFLLWLLTSWKYHLSRIRTAPGSAILCLFYFLILLYGLFDWQLFRDTANSTSYDLIVTACTLLAVSFLAEEIFGETPVIPSFSVFFITITLATIGFKFSGIFSVFLIGYYLLRNRTMKDLAPVIKNSATVTAIAGIIIIPVLIRNCIVTGYPLYPLTFTIGQPDWKVPAPMTGLLHEYITWSNRYYDQDFGISTSSRNDHIGWITGWFTHILWQHKIIIGLVLSSISLFFARSPALPDRRNLRRLTLALLLMAAGWFLTAPSPRFGYGVLLCAAFLPVSIALGGRIRPVWYAGMLAAATLAGCIYLPAKAALLLRSPQYWLRPQTIESPAYRTLSVHGTGFHLPENLYGHKDHRCYNTDLPCVCEDNPYLQPRGASLQDGFRMNPAPDSAFIQNYNY